MSAPAVEAEGLRKTFRATGRVVEAVRGVDLAVEPGEFVGLLGPNGAGKSTIMGILTTLVRPTGGWARVAGHDPVGDPLQVKRRIGLVSQNNTLDRELTAGENLEFRGRYFGMSRKVAGRRRDQLLEAFGLDEQGTARGDELSGGQAKRLMIARALVHAPEVLFLDEPTAGLDPQSRVLLWDLLRSLHAEGQTVVLTNHYLEEAEALCERLVILDRGVVVATGTADELASGLGGDTVLVVEFDGPPPKGVHRLASRRGAARLVVDGHHVRLRGDDPDATMLNRVVELGLAAGLRLRTVTREEPTLEDVFLSVTCPAVSS